MAPRRPQQAGLLPRLFLHPGTARHRLGHARRVRWRGQTDQPDTVRAGFPRLARELKDEARLAHARRPREGEQAGRGAASQTLASAIPLFRDVRRSTTHRSGLTRITPAIPLSRDVAGRCARHNGGRARRTGARAPGTDGAMQTKGVHRPEQGSGDPATANLVERKSISGWPAAPPTTKHQKE
jgi:hypothetical protein